MKRIIGIAMCAIMLAGAAQVSAQKKNSGNNKQKTEQKSGQQKSGQKPDQQKQEPKDGQQRPGPAGGDRQFTPEDMAKSMADRMKEQLSLTDDQYTKVLELNREQTKQYANMPRPSREEMQNMTDEQREARRDEMRKYRDEYNAKLKSILTSEQYSKYEENMNSTPYGQRGPGPQRGPHSGN